MKKIKIFCIFTLTIILDLKPCSCCLEMTESNKVLPELWQEAKTVYEFTVADLDGKQISLEKYRGLVLIIINIASHCSFSTSNFEELKYLQKKYYADGLRILAFPCNQFLFEEPNDAQAIRQYIEKRELNFEVFGKIDVNGNYTPQLWKFLKSKQAGTLFNYIKWNYTKFIVDRKGIPVERLSTLDTTEYFERKILQYL